MSKGRPLQLELGQRLERGFVRGDPLDAGHRLLRRPFGSVEKGREKSTKVDETQPTLAHMDDVSFNVGAWVARAFWLEAHWTASQDFYDQMAAHARRLTPTLIRTGRHRGAMRDLEQFLRESRGQGLGWEHGRYWTRARLGELITEATNRGRQLALGRLEPKVRGPALDPMRLPDDRLDHLIQTHRDIAIVDVLRAERARRSGA